MRYLSSQLIISLLFLKISNLGLEYIQIISKILIVFIEDLTQLDLLLVSFKRLPTGSADTTLIWALPNFFHKSTFSYQIIKSC